MAVVTFGSDGLNTTAENLTITNNQTGEQVIFLNLSRSNVICAVGFGSGITLDGNSTTGATFSIPAESYRIVIVDNSNTTGTHTIGFNTSDVRAQAIHGTGAQEGQSVSFFRLAE